MLQVAQQTGCIDKVLLVKDTHKAVPVTKSVDAAIEWHELSSVHTPATPSLYT
jgi:2-C-methyl-D-erythritol 4-phosphate cytidylyltransferase